MLSPADSPIDTSAGRGETQGGSAARLSAGLPARPAGATLRGMVVDPSRYQELPENRHGISAGCLLFPTATPIVAGGGSSLGFVHEQGGDDGTFIFILGQRRTHTLLGEPVDIIEGVFLSEAGPGFHPTWDFEQLLRETDLGGWRVVPTEEVLSQWASTVERRMNAC